MFMQAITLTSILALANAGLLLGGGLGYGGIELATGGLGSGGGYGYGRYYARAAVNYYAPPRYEYKYGVQDYHTGDLKEKVESRMAGLTRTEYGWAQKDRQVQESRVFASHY